MLLLVLPLVLGNLDLCQGRQGCALTLTAEPSLLPAAKEAAKRLGLDAKVAEREPRPAAQKPPTDAKLAYRVSQRDGEVVVTLRSLDRPVEVYGEARQAPQRVGKAAWQARALEVAVRTAMERAAVDFRARAREADLGRRALAFSVRLSGLNEAGRGAARHLLSCLEGQLDLAGPLSEPNEHAGYLEDAVEYLPKAGEPRDNLPFMAQQVKGWLLAPRAPCSPAGTALDRLDTTVEVDALNRALLISFSP